MFAATPDVELLLTQRSDAAAPLYLDAASTPPEIIRSLVASVAPNYIINCAGILNSRIIVGDSASLATAMEVNGNFPHHLATAAEECGAKVIHVSTDGVFSGQKKEPYLESDRTDATDNYGRSKIAGECGLSHVLNVRCSIIGRNPESGRGLLEWLLSVPDGSEADGYFDQMWNGVTSKQLARLCLSLTQNDLFDAVRRDGHVVHFCPNPPISKYDLLCLWRDATGKDVIIQQRAKPATVASRVLASKHDSWRKAVEGVGNWPELLQECKE